MPLTVAKLVVALVFIAAPAVGQTRTQTAATQPRPADSQPAAIPFEICSNKPFLQVRVNDSEPLWFILDTGSAGACCIDRDVAVALGLNIHHERHGHVGAGEGAQVDLGTTAGVTFTVGDVKLTDQSAAVVPLKHVAEYEGRGTDGTLGGDFFRRYVVEVNYPERTVRVHDPQTYAYVGSGRSVPLRFLNGLPVARAAVTVPGRDPLTADLVIDTGTRGAIFFNRPFVEEHDLLKTIRPTYAATVGGGVGGESKGLVGRIVSLQLGPFLINKPVAVFSTDRTGVLASPAFAGIIGGQILRRCKVVFDYPHERMILEPAAATPAPYEHDMSGLFLVAEGPDFRRFKVQSVMRDSPAAEAGLQRGDVITGIDGRPAADFTLEQVRQLFMEHGRRCRVEIKRHDQRFTVELELRRLI